MAASSINSHIPRLQHRDWQLSWFRVDPPAAHRVDRAPIHQGDVLLWEELSGLPRGIPESQRRQGSKGRQPVGTEVCKDEKRRRCWALFPNAQPSVGHTEKPAFTSFIPRLERTWKGLWVITQATLAVPQWIFGASIMSQALPATGDMTMNQTGKALVIREPK